METKKQQSTLEYASIQAMKGLISSNFITNVKGDPDVRYNYTELAKEAIIYAKELLDQLDNSN